MINRLIFCFWGFPLVSSLARAQQIKKQPAVTTISVENASSFDPAAATGMVESCRQKASQVGRGFEAVIG
jgi:hypothetical protein